MKIKIVVILLLLSNMNFSSAQEKSVGFSAPGSLGIKLGKEVTKGTINTGITDLICTISYREDSGDEILCDGETAIITILVRNYSKKKTFRPKLEIMRMPNRLVRPSLKIVFLGGIRPGKMAAYKEVLPWKEEFSSCTMKYTIQAVDSRYGMSSEKMEVSFYVHGFECETMELEK